MARPCSRARAWAVVAALLPAAVFAEEVTAKVVWIDEKNSSLLIECPDKGCAAIPNAKPGETYTFVIPSALKTKVVALKEGETVKVVYEDRKDGGYVITSVVNP